MSALKCENRFKASLLPHLVSLCPTLELIAVVILEKQELEVYRFSGQRAFVWKRPSSSEFEVEGLEWQPNGSHIALAWNDGVIEIVDTELGKLAQHLDVKTSESDGKRPALASLFWSKNALDAAAVKGSAEANGRASTNSDAGPDPEHANSTSIEDWFHEIDANDFDTEKDHINALHSKVNSASEDLPRHLALIDVEAELPKLSPLPHVDDKAVFSTSPDKFTSQAGVDICFPIYTNEMRTSDTVDTLLTCWTDESVSVILQGSFVAGHYTLDELGKQGRRVVAHTSDMHSNRHVLLSESTEDKAQAPSLSERSETKDLSLDILSFNGITQTSYLVPFLIQKITSLSHLSDYITHTIVNLRQAWATAQDLPNRYISNVRDSLSETEDEFQLDSAFYHLAVTGDCPAVVKEWLIDQLAERGQQRWDTSLTTGYAHILTLTHSHLLPVLEHATVLISRLRSLARDPSVPLLPSSMTRELTRLLDNISLLTTITHHLQIHTSRESQQFAAFSAWLSCQLTLLSSEPYSTAADDAAEKAASLDFSLLLPYIQDTLLGRSSLNFFLGPGRSSQSIVEQPRRPGLQVKEAILGQILERHRRECVQPGGEKVELVNLLHQALFVRDAVRGVCESVPEAFGKATDVVRRVRVCEGVEEGMVDVMQRDGTVDVFAVPKAEAGERRICRYRVPLEDSKDSSTSTEYAPQHLPPIPNINTILSITHLPHHLLVLARTSTSTLLLSLAIDRDRSRSEKWHTLQKWEDGARGFTPGKLEVRNATENRVELALVVDAEGRGWQVWNLRALRQGGK
ncbi:MAG: hypothetical protein M1828_001546 [Chrysothrix sp. TS-e1954]|nr:MAG: hypothetical protein M1828_001546 [Chrysothrix sp. TS-e1954]